jgi:hypothetical protein
LQTVCKLGVVEQRNTEASDLSGHDLVNVPREIGTEDQGFEEKVLVEPKLGFLCGGPKFS